MNIGSSGHDWQQFLDAADAARKRNNSFRPVSDPKMQGSKKSEEVVPQEDITLEASRLGEKIYRTENRAVRSDNHLGQRFDAYA